MPGRPIEARHRMSLRGPRAFDAIPGRELPLTPGVSGASPERVRGRRAGVRARMSRGIR